MYKLYLSKLGEKISLLIWCLENFKEVWVLGKVVLGEKHREQLGSYCLLIQVRGDGGLATVR